MDLHLTDEEFVRLIDVLECIIFDYSDADTSIEHRILSKCLQLEKK